MSGKTAAPLYPLLFALVPALSVAAGNAGAYDLPDLLTVCAVMLAMVGIALAAMIGLIHAVTRGREREGLWPAQRTRELAALLVMIAVAWIFYYVPVQGSVETLSWRLSRPSVLIPVGIAITVAPLVAMARRPGCLPRFSHFMNVFGVILLALGIVRMARGQSAPRAVQGSAFVASLAHPVPLAGPVPPGRNEPKRDIYLIVADAHPNAAVLAKYVGVDNTAFEDSLRSLGFVIPRNMRSNYTQTVLSLPSLLNFTHVTPLARERAAVRARYVVPRYLIEHNRAVRFLHSQGYKFVFFPSASFSLTEHNAEADQTYNAWPEHTLGTELRRTELRVALLESTLLGLGPRVAAHDEHSPAAGTHIVRTMQALKRVPSDPAPTFTFVHVMAPHPPYVVDSSCKPLDRPVSILTEPDLPKTRDLFVGQLRCVDRLILEVATELRRASPVPPVIAIVGDHGTRFSDPYFMSHPERVRPALLHERFGAFGAFYAPAGGDSLFSGDVSLVNVMTNVLRYYFNADITPAPNAEYVSGYQIFEFYPGGDTLEAEHEAAPLSRAASTQPPAGPATKALRHPFERARVDGSFQRQL